jgi:hypothetical protein
MKLVVKEHWHPGEENHRSEVLTHKSRHAQEECWRAGDDLQGLRD